MRYAVSLHGKETGPLSCFRIVRLLHLLPDIAIMLRIEVIAPALGCLRSVGRVHVLSVHFQHSCLKLLLGTVGYREEQIAVLLLPIRTPGLLKI